jgi:hypothetical protein
MPPRRISHLYRLLILAGAALLDLIKISGKPNMARRPVKGCERTGRGVAMVLGALVVAGAGLSGSRPANATAVTYDLSNVTATFGSDGTDTITGSFTYDSTTQSGTADFTVTGPVLPDGYSAPGGAQQASTQIEAEKNSDEFAMALNFVDGLAMVSDALSLVSFNPNCPECGTQAVSTAVTGEAVPQLAPEPMSVALLISGLLGIGVARRAWPGVAAD